MILLGEHVVVYGRPALATGLPLGIDGDASTRAPARGSISTAPPATRAATRLVAEAARADRASIRRSWSSRVRSSCRRGAGSAARRRSRSPCCAAAAAAAGPARSPHDDLRARPRRSSAIFHGTPSGVDPGGRRARRRACRFVRGEPPTVDAGRASARPLPARRSRTAAARAQHGRRRRRAARALGRPIARATSASSTRSRRVVEAGVRRGRARRSSTALGAAFDRNQALLDGARRRRARTIATQLAAARAAGRARREAHRRRRRRRDHRCRRRRRGGGDARCATGRPHVVVDVAMRRTRSRERAVAVHDSSGGMGHDDAGRTGGA